MPAASCAKGHAIVTPTTVALPTTCPLGTCGQPLRPRSAAFGQAIRSAVPVR